MRARSVLEIGPGSGIVSDWLRRSGVDVTTLDMDRALRSGRAGFCDRAAVPGRRLRRDALLSGARAHAVRGGGARLGRVGSGGPERRGDLRARRDPVGGPVLSALVPRLVSRRGEGADAGGSFRSAEGAGAPRVPPERLAVPAPSARALVAGRPHARVAATCSARAVAAGAGQPAFLGGGLGRDSARATARRRGRRGTGARAHLSRSREPVAPLPGSPAAATAISPAALQRIAGRLAGFPHPDDYGAYSAYAAARHAGAVAGKSVLVVGCNRGEDCRRFVRMRAAEVHGLDPNR